MNFHQNVTSATWNKTFKISSELILMENGFHSEIYKIPDMKPHYGHLLSDEVKLNCSLNSQWTLSGKLCALDWITRRTFKAPEQACSKSNYLIYHPLSLEAFYRTLKKLCWTLDTGEITFGAGIRTVIYFVEKSGGTHWFLLAHLNNWMR